MELEILHSGYSFRESTSVAYIPFTPTNLSTSKLLAFKNPALPTPIRGRVCALLFPPNEPSRANAGLKTLISVTL